MRLEDDDDDEAATQSSLPASGADVVDGHGNGHGDGGGDEAGEAEASAEAAAAAAVNLKRLPNFDMAVSDLDQHGCC